MRLEFLDIRSRLDAPCVFVTHDREEAAIVANRIALITDGRIIETASVREIFSEPKTVSAANFFGAGQVLPCRVLEKYNDIVEVSSPLGILTVTTPSEFSPEKPMVFIPYEGFSFSSSDKAAWKNINARITGSVFEGSKLAVKLLLPPWESGQGQKEDEPISIELAASPRLKIPESGSNIGIWIDQSLIRFVK